MSSEPVPRPHPAQCVYGVVVYWLCIAASLVCIVGPVCAIAFPGNTVANPHFLFSAIWRGLTPDQVWESVSNGFPGGHFWIRNLGTGDGLTQFGLVLGCLSAGISLLGAGITYLAVRPRSWGWGCVCFFAAAMVFLSMAGIYRG